MPESDSREQIGEALATARKSAKLTQAQVADYLNKSLDGSYSQPVVARMESGKRAVNVSELLAWSAAISMDPATLISSVSKPTPIAQLLESKEAVGKLDSDAPEEIEKISQLERRVNESINRFTSSDESSHLSGIEALRSLNRISLAFSNIRTNIARNAHWASLVEDTINSFYEDNVFDESFPKSHDEIVTMIDAWAKNGI